jgi:hypothetical protein
MLMAAPAIVGKANAAAAIKPNGRRFVVFITLFHSIFS